MLVPKLRFKREDGAGYPEWEEKPLSNYLYENKDRNRNNEYSKQDVLSVSGDYGVVNQIEFQGRSFAGTDVSLYHILYSGDIVYTKSPLKANPYGIIKFNCGKSGIVSTLYAVYHCKPSVDGKFVEYYFDNDLKLNHYLKPLVNIGSKHDMKINNEYALSGYVVFPCLEEQQKIADLLSTVDEVIAQSEAEVQNLQQQKKTVMQKIFSQEVRFKREDGTEYPEWEEKTLSELCDVRDGTHDSPKYVKNGFPLVTSKNLTKYGTIDFYNINFISEEDYNIINNRSKVNIGDILFGMIGTIGKPVLVKSTGFAIKNVALLKPLYIDNSFLFYYLQSDKVEKIFRYEQTGNTQKFIALNTIRQLKIIVPHKEEQQKIADFLSTYDETISYAKKELDKWKELKKGLLQQMFV